MTNLLMLTEAGEGIGYGHYSRCSAIQQAAIEKGLGCKMLLYTKGDFAPDIDGDIADWINNRELVRRHNHYDIALIDSYLAGGDYYGYLKSVFNRVVVIDDYNRIKYSADLIINPNVYFADIDYSNQKCTAIGGSDFVILRKPFRDYHTGEADINDSINNILITLGGSDFRNLLPELANTLNDWFSGQITVIDPEGRFESRRSNISVVGRQDEYSMRKLFLDSDLVISGCGQSLHELAATGKPVVGICLDSDQKYNRDFYYKRGFLTKKIDWNSEKFDELIKSAVQELAPAYIRRILHYYGPKLLNKHGIYNIIKHIYSS
jgi:spore coat polysaccharide biosynthesis predicted glycosyltransferase SpsG